MANSQQGSLDAVEFRDLNDEITEDEYQALVINLKHVLDDANRKAISEFKAAEKYIKKYIPELPAGKKSLTINVTDTDSEEVVGVIALKLKNVSASKAREATTRTEKSIIPPK